jgi:hypothetical protein
MKNAFIDFLPLSVGKSASAVNADRQTFRGYCAITASSTAGTLAPPQR